MTGQSGHTFAASQWNGGVRIFKMTQKENGEFIQTLKSFDMRGPVTSCCWNNDNTILYVGMANGTIKCISIDGSMSVTEFASNSR